MSQVRSGAQDGRPFHSSISTLWDQATCLQLSLSVCLSAALNRVITDKAYCDGALQTMTLSVFPVSAGDYAFCTAHQAITTHLHLFAKQEKSSQKQGRKQVT